MAKDLRALKSAFDPAGVMNPGLVLRNPSQRKTFQ
ncbi:FAD-binding oxidoreductase [Methylovirgula sp. 4M-Z18]|nr:FAD-binding oxidoreductase [Methylovirgula sp. 4M-Z18]